MFGAVCAMLASCSSDEPANQQPAQGTDSGYVSFEINLPTVNGSRAYSYDAGSADEYAVNNAKIYLWQKTADGDPVYVSEADIYGMNWSAKDEGDVTTTSKATAKINSVNLNNNDIQYQALVVLNVPSNFIAPTSGQKFSIWSEQAQNCPMQFTEGGHTYLTMSNFNEYCVGSDNKPYTRTLVDVDKTAIAATEGALKKDACTVSVQRVLAKAYVTLDNEYTIANGNFTGDKVAIQNWNLDITNKTTYPVQVTAGLTAFTNIWSTDRFFHNGNNTHRIFWAKDPNYDTFAATDFNKVTTVTGDPAKPQYCMENTFDVANQRQDRTTRVVLKAKYTPAGITDNTFYRINNGAFMTAANLQTEIANKAKTVTGKDATVDVAAIVAGGRHALSEVSIKFGATAATAEELTLIAKALGLTSSSDKNINTFADGICYYVVRIQHFGNECPWSVGDPTYGETTNLQESNKKYLGRYGVVRNHVYEIKVKSISVPGTPDIPTPGPDPDDENNYYISASVNVLSWAKRVNEVDL